MLSALKQQNTETEDPVWDEILAELEANDASPEEIQIAWEEYQIVKLSEVEIIEEEEVPSTDDDPKAYTIPTDTLKKDLRVIEKDPIEEIVEEESGVDEETEEEVEEELTIEPPAEEKEEEERFIEIERSPEDIEEALERVDTQISESQDNPDLLDKLFKEKASLAAQQEGLYPYPEVLSHFYELFKEEASTTTQQEDLYPFPVTSVGEAEIISTPDVPEGAVPVEVFYGGGDRDEKDLVQIMEDSHGKDGKYEFSQKVWGDDVLGIKNTETGKSIQIPLQTKSTPEGDVVEGYQDYLKFIYGEETDTPGIISTQIHGLESKYNTEDLSTEDWLKHITPKLVEVSKGDNYASYKEEQIGGFTREDDPIAWEAKRLLHEIYTRINEFTGSSMEDYTGNSLTDIIKDFNKTTDNPLSLDRWERLMNAPGFTTVEALEYATKGVWPDWDVTDYLSYRSKQEQAAWIDEATDLLAPVIAKWGTVEIELNRKLQDKYLAPMLEEFEIELEQMLKEVDMSEMTENEVYGLISQLDTSFIEELQNLIKEDEEYIQFQEDYAQEVIKVRDQFNDGFKITTSYLKPTELEKISRRLDGMDFKNRSWRTKKLLLAHELKTYIDNAYLIGTANGATGPSPNDILDIKREFWSYFYEKLAFDENEEATLFANKDLAENQLEKIEAWVDSEVERLKVGFWKELKNGKNPHRVWSGSHKDPTTQDLDRFSGYDEWYEWYTIPKREGGGGGSDEVENNHGDLNRDKILSHDTVKLQTKKYAEDILNAKDTDWDNSGLSNFYSGLTASRIQEIIPIVGGVINMTDAYRIYAISQKSAEERTDPENELLTAYSIKQTVDGIISENSMWYNAGKMSAYSLSFMGEMILTGGSFTATKKVIGRGIKKRLLKLISPEHVSKIRFKPGTSQILPGFIPTNITTKVGKGLIPTFQNVDKIVSRIADPIAFLTATAAQTAVSQHRILATTFEEMTPEMVWAFSDDANELFEIYSNSFDKNGEKLKLRDAEFNTWSVVPKVAGEDFEGDTGRGALEAYGVGFGITATEMFTERLGFHIPGATKAVLNSAGITDEFIQRFTFGYLIRKLGYSEVSVLRKAIGEGMFWSGPAIEYLEEMIAMPMQNIITGQPVFAGIAETDQFGYYTGGWDSENLSTIFISVAAMSSGFSSMQLLGPKSAGQSHIDGLTYKSEKELIKALETQLNEGTFKGNIFSNNLTLTERIEALLEKKGSDPTIVKTPSGFGEELDKVVATDIEVIEQLKTIDKNHSPSYYNELRAEEQRLIDEKRTEQQSGKSSKEKVRAIKPIDARLVEIEGIINNIEITPAYIDKKGDEVPAVTIGSIRSGIIKKKRTEIYQKSINRVKETLQNAGVGENQLLFQEALNEEEAIDQLRDYILKYDHGFTENGEPLPPLRAVLNKFGYWNGSVEVIGREFITFELPLEHIELIELAAEEARDKHGIFRRVPGDKDIPALIIVNKTAAINNEGNRIGNLHVAEHELLHFILHKTMRENPATILAIGQGLHSHLMGIDPRQVKDQRFKQRIQKYIKTQGDVVAAEETLTMFVDALNAGYFVNNSTLLTRLGDGLRRTFNQMGYEIVLSDPKQVYNFLIDYNQEIGKGRLSPSMQDVKDKGLTLSGDLESLAIDIEALNQFKQELIEAGLLFSAEEESEKVQELYNEKGKDGKWEIAMAYEGMANSLFNKNLARAVTEDQRHALLSNKDDIIFETLYGPTGVMKLVETYNPEVDPILARYINKWLQKRVLKIYDKYAGIEQVSTQSISDEATLAEAEQVTGASASGDQMIDSDGLPVNVILLEAEIFGDVESSSTGKSQADIRDEVRTTVETSEIGADALVELRTKKSMSIPKVVGQEIAGVEMIPVVDKNGKPKLNKKGEQVFRLPNKNAEVVTTGKLWGILESIAAEFGVDPKRVVSQQTFNTKMRSAARALIIAKQVELRQGLPKQFTPNGDSVGLMPNILKAFYEEIEVRGGTKAATDLGLVGMAGKGLQLWVLKDLTQEEWIEEFMKPGTSSDQLIKGLIKQLATQITIQEIKLPLEGIAPLDILSLLGEGRGENMYSQELTDEEMQEIRTQAGNLADPIENSIDKDIFLANLPLLAKAGINLINPEEIVKVIELEFDGVEGITSVAKELAKNLSNSISYINSVNKPLFTEEANMAIEALGEKGIEEANAIIEHRNILSNESGVGENMFSEEFEDILGEGIEDLNEDFNEIVEVSKGIGKQKVFSPAKARLRGKKKGKFKFFIPPSAEDFAGLCYSFLGKGKIGEEQHEWFKRNLFNPYAKGIRNINNLKQIIANDSKSIKKAFPNAASLLSKSVKGVPEFNYSHAVRVYNWVKNGITVPGLSKTDQAILIETVKGNKELLTYAMATEVIVNKAGGYTELQGPAWLAGSTSSDMVDALNKSREIYLEKWQSNVDIIFSEDNLNKIEAGYGTNFREALEDMLYRMRTGASRPMGQNKIMNNFVNWINGSVGTTMFFNSRSAVLQMISNVNFLNWTDNNLLAAAKAFANPKQYWADVAMIFNSDFLKQRRSGLQTDINAAELLKDIQSSENTTAAAIGHLLRLGFLPTQIADSFAIATGGATMYRNRVESLVESGMSMSQAENQAFIDMQEIAEETQQSARPDKVSQQQASPLGKIILAFQNTPMQYNRIIKKATLDLINGRGDPKEHISKIVYYGGIQNIIFYGLQTALFAFMFDGDEEKKGKAYARTVNGMVDTLLRGTGVTGAVISTVKNTIIKFIEENEKLNDDIFYTDPNWGNVIVEGLNVSPPLGIKARKINNSLKTWEYNQDLIDHMDITDFDNPIWSATTQTIEAVTNAPLNRGYNKTKNVRESLNADNEAWKRIHTFIGWSSYGLGLEPQAVVDAKLELSEIKTIEKEERKEQNKIDRKKKEDEEHQVLEEGFIEDQQQEREEGKDEVTCASVNKQGERCSLKPVGDGKFCTVHQEVKQNTTGKKTQCTHIKDNGKRCGVQTSNASGKCYYHD